MDSTDKGASAGSWKESKGNPFSLVAAMFCCRFRHEITFSLGLTAARARTTAKLSTSNIQIRLEKGQPPRQQCAHFQDDGVVSSKADI